MTNTDQQRRVERLKVRRATLGDMPEVFWLRSEAYDRAKPEFNHRELRTDAATTRVYVVEDLKGRDKLLPYGNVVATWAMKVAHSPEELDEKLEVEIDELVTHGIPIPFRRDGDVVLTVGRMAVHRDCRNLGLTRMVRQVMHDVVASVDEAQALMGLVADTKNNPIARFLRRFDGYTVEGGIRTDRAIFEGDQVVYQLLRAELEGAQRDLEDLREEQYFPSYEWTGDDEMF